MVSQRGGEPQSIETLISRMKSGLQFSGGLSAEEAEEAFNRGRMRNKTEAWKYLHPTVTLQAAVDEALARWQTYQQSGDVQPSLSLSLQRAVVNAEAVLADGVERDEYRRKLGRPESCWCFGDGGHTVSVVATGTNPHRSKQGDIVVDRAYVGNDPEQVWMVCCPYCDEGIEAAERKSALNHALLTGAEVEKKVVWSKGWTQSGIPTRFQSWRLETSPVGEFNPDLHIRLGFHEPRWMLFSGAVGRGKTGLCIGLAWQWREKYHLPVRFVSMPNFLAEIRATYDKRHPEGLSEVEVIARYSDEKMILIIDDLGAEHLAGTGWAEDKIYTIFSNRAGSSTAYTLITSNHNDTVILERLGARVYWRIEEMCQPDAWIVVAGPNLRDPDEVAAARQKLR